MATSTIKMTNASGVGYCKMGDGTLVQWGRGEIPANSDRTEITFPITFYQSETPKCFLTVLENGYTGTITLYAWQELYAKLNVLNKGATQSKIVYFYWLAIGRWK